MNQNRINGIESLKKNSKVNHILVTNDNLPEYILVDHPLHKGYRVSCPMFTRQII
jgi:hypothetical protein